MHTRQKWESAYNASPVQPECRPRAVPSKNARVQCECMPCAVRVQAYSCNAKRADAMQGPCSRHAGPVSLPRFNHISAPLDFLIFLLRLCCDSQEQWCQTSLYTSTSLLVLRIHDAKDAMSLLVLLLAIMMPKMQCTNVGSIL